MREDMKVYQEDLFTTPHPELALDNQVIGKPITENSKPLALSKIKLFTFVYEELSKHAGKEVSAAALMRATKTLIEISKNEYSDKVAQEYGGSPQLYAMELTRAYRDHQWSVLYFQEESMPTLKEDDFYQNELAAFRQINLGLNETTWGL